MAERKKIKLKGIQELKDEIDRRINGKIKFTETINLDDENEV
jgi:hypothetical protein